MLSYFYVLFAFYACIERYSYLCPLGYNLRQILHAIIGGLDAAHAKRRGSAIHFVSEDHLTLSCFPSFSVFCFYFLGMYSELRRTPYVFLSLGITSFLFFSLLPLSPFLPLSFFPFLACPHAFLPSTTLDPRPRFNLLFPRLPHSCIRPLPPSPTQGLGFQHLIQQVQRLRQSRPWFNAWLPCGTEPRYRSVHLFDLLTPYQRRLP